jgi:hypothetical protein
VRAGTSRLIKPPAIETASKTSRIVMPLLEDRATLGGLKNEDLTISERKTLILRPESTIKKANRSWSPEQAAKSISSPEALKETAV